MPDDHKDEHREMLRLLRENNEFLKKLNRRNAIGFWIRLVWFAVIIGLPFAVYFYFLEPYFEVFGANYEVFRQGMAEIPGLKGLDSILP